MQKEFFLTEPFNPSPYWENSFLINLSGSAKYEQNTIFLPGRYEVLVQAGSCFTGNGLIGYSGKISKTINVYEKFIVRAYCGSSGTSGNGGTNPYSGGFKVNPYHGDISSVSHIFGNCGASGRIKTDDNTRVIGSGNCLGNGGSSYGYISTGAGSCMHIMPVSGTFGTNYFYAFHTTSSAAGSIGIGACGGSGSSYGGSGSGGVRINPLSQGSLTGYSGGGTPYGNGGAKVTQSGAGYTSGKNGTGIGHGFGVTSTLDDIGTYAQGSAAWFDGSRWVDITTRTSKNGEQGRIYLKYLGTV